MFTKTANLVLRHSDISTDVTAVTASSSAGSWSNGKQSVTFKVDLRKLIGAEIYDDAEEFVLRLNQFANVAANFPLSVQDRSVIIRVSGLNFVSSSYDTRTSNNGPYYNMLLTILATSDQCYNYSPNTSICNFRKSQPEVELTFEYIRMIDGLAAQYGAVDKFPHCVYSFDVYKIK